MKRTAIIFIPCLICLCSCDSIRNRIEERIHGEKTSDPVTVRVMPAGESENTGTASYVGTVESSRSSTLICPASGTVSAVYVREGQKVSKGQKLVKIESQSIQSAYEMSRATLDQAQDGLERLSKVYESGSIPEVKMVEMRTNLEKARASERAAFKALSDCEVKAPFQGVVEGLSVTEGEDAEIAKILMRIVDPNSIEIHFPLPENEFMKVSPGDRATVSIPALGKETTAVVSAKGVVASPLSHSYDCTLGNFTAPEGLMPGMVCKVYLKSNGAKGIVIPASSVMTDNEGRYVWLVRDGKVEKRHISVGGYSGDGIIASEGLEKGESVIVEGARKVSGGMTVKVIE